jgi:uncharacterized protein with HEPN domain
MGADKLYIQHILDAITAIEQYTKRLTLTAFVRADHKMAQDAVIRELSIIGEATKRLSKRMRNAHRGLPWKEITGMRDKLIHDYFGVDLEVVWHTVKHDLPPLKAALKKYTLPR